MQHSVIDLTFESQDEQDAQKARIMTQAQSVLASRAPGQAAAQQSPEVVILDSSQEPDEEPERAKRPRFEQQGQAPLQPAVTAHVSGPPLNPLNDMLRMLHQERLSRQQHGQPTAEAPGSSQKRKASAMEDAGHSAAAPQQPATLSVLTYNLWMDCSVELEQRMAGLVRLIRELRPDIVLFQEFCHPMYEVFTRNHRHDLLREYEIQDLPEQYNYGTTLGYRRDTVTVLRDKQREDFLATQMGRGVESICVRPKGGGPSVAPVLVATSHLESPMGRGQEHTEARIVQLEEGQSTLERLSAEIGSRMPPRHGTRGPVDIVWGGDMNWVPDQKPPKLWKDWQDLWAVHNAGDLGATWDPRTNDLIKASRYKPGRLDRFFAKLRDWRVESLHLVGTQPIPGLMARRSQDSKHPSKVHISDHHGVLLRLVH